MSLASGRASIAICDRCQQKRPYRMLIADGNTRGLRVCSDRDCWDPKDPWRLPPLQPDAISLKYPRPDTPLWPFANEFNVPSNAYISEFGDPYVTEDGLSYYVTE